MEKNTPKIKNKSDQVVDRIVESLLEGSLVPGERLPVEQDLANIFGVSRITIREAFKKLSLMGLVDVRQGDGTFVSETSPDFFMRPLLPMLLLNKQNIEDLYDAREMIEAGNAYYAALSENKLGLDKLKRCQEAMEKRYISTAPNAIALYARADQNFHQALSEMSNNIYLNKIYSVVSIIFSSCIEKTSFFNVARNSSIKEHEEIIRAIEKKDPQAAKAKMEHHIKAAKKFYLELK